MCLSDLEIVGELCAMCLCGGEHSGQRNRPNRLNSLLEGRRITVQAEIIEGRLRVDVVDTGVGLPASACCTSNCTRAYASAWPIRKINLQVNLYQKICYLA